jgi:hypothetical protein
VVNDKLQRLRLLIDGMLLAAQLEKNEQVKRKILDNAARLEKRLKEEEGGKEQAQELD